MVMGSKRFKIGFSEDSYNDYYMDYEYTDINNNTLNEKKCSKKRKLKHREEIINTFLSKHVSETNFSITNILREYDSILQNENLKSLLEHYKKFADEELLHERDMYDTEPKKRLKLDKFDEDLRNYKFNNNFDRMKKIENNDYNQIFNLHQSTYLKENVQHLKVSNINYNINFDFEDQTLNLDDFDDASTKNLLNLAIDTTNFDCTEYTESGFVSSDIINETKSLYAYHIIREMHLEHLVVPHTLLNYLNGVPIHFQKLILLADKFKHSKARSIVNQRAENVELTTVNFRSFTDLLYGLFQNGGVTWERIMVLFFFCADISIRALREKLNIVFNRILLWTTNFLTHTVAFIIQKSGGWDCVLSESSIKRFMVFSSVGLFTGFVTSFLYANLTK